MLNEQDVHLKLRRMEPHCQTQYRLAGLSHQVDKLESVRQEEHEGQEQYRTSQVVHNKETNSLLVDRRDEEESLKIHRIMHSTMWQKRRDPISTTI